MFNLFYGGATNALPIFIMPTTSVFPYSKYEVEVYDKTDIISEINQSDIDKDLLVEIIDDLEEDIINFIKDGRWTGIPYLGNIRIPEGIVLNNTPEQKELISDAYNTMTRKEYGMFRYKLAVDNDIRIKSKRLFNYKASMNIRKFPKLYRRICKIHDANFVKIFMYTLSNINECKGDEDRETDY